MLEKDLKEIEDTCEIVKYAKNSSIFIEGNYLDGMFLIIKGKIKLTFQSSNQRSMTFTILSEYDSLGLLESIYNCKSVFSAICLTDSELLCISQYKILTLLNQNSKLWATINSEFAFNLTKTYEAIKTLTLNGVEKKITRVIILFAEEFGVRKNSSVEIKDIPTQLDLALLIGTTRESVSRTLTSLNKRKKISFKRSSIVIPDYEKFKKEFS